MKNFTSNANSFICILNEASSEESISSGNAMQSHHLQTLRSEYSDIVPVKSNKNAHVRKLVQQRETDRRKRMIY